MRGAGSYCQCVMAVRRNRVPGSAPLLPAGRSLRPRSQHAQPDDRRLWVTVESEPARVRSEAREEIYLIGRDAIRNAIEHAGTSAIKVDIAYGTTFCPHVRDDGQRMEQDRVRQGPWGLKSMRERGLRPGAALKIWSAAGYQPRLASTKAPAMNRINGCCNNYPLLPIGWAR